MSTGEINAKFALRRLVLLAVIFVPVTIVFVLGVDEQFSLENLQAHHQELLLWTKKTGS